eukprot:SAG11_NODE_15183_length_586_cov_1.176591_1_plen_58_part_10
MVHRVAVLVSIVIPFVKGAAGQQFMESDDSAQDADIFGHEALAKNGDGSEEKDLWFTA